VSHTAAEVAVEQLNWAAGHSGYGPDTQRAVQLGIGYALLAIHDELVKLNRRPVFHPVTGIEISRPQAETSD
jgi:hypothetical protein